MTGLDTVSIWGQQRKQRRMTGQPPSSVVLPIPPPYGGLNAQDALASMPPEDAIILDNYFPGAGGVTLRNGSRIHTTGGMGGGTVSTLMTWASGANQKMLGAANGHIYNCSTFNANGSSLASGYSSDQWQWVMFRGSLNFVNGVDVPQAFDGSDVTQPDWDGPDDISKLIHINAFRSRLYFVEKDTLSVWYAPIDGTSGTLIKFDMQSEFQRGGYLQYMATWTQGQAGAGMNDLAVFVSSTGEILIYTGGYPGDSNWYRMGRFQTLHSIGLRSFLTYGADLMILTPGGLIPMSAVISVGIQQQLSQAITFKINKLITQAHAVYGDNFGWQVQTYFTGNFLLINVPVSTTSGSIVAWQFVVNLLTGAWCRFLGQNGLCWTVFNDLLYFGTGTGKVVQADYGTSDLSTGTLKTNGTAITGSILGAYNAFQMPGQLKQFTNIQPLIASNGALSLSIAMQVDYRQNALIGTQSINQSGSAWNISPWNTTPWGDASVVNRDWEGVGAVGHVGAVQIASMTTSTPVTVQGYNVMFTPGGNL